MSESLAQLEALLFISGEPMALSRLSRILDVSRKEIEATAERLRIKLEQDQESGIHLIEHDGMVELATKGEFSSLGESLIKGMREENLSRAALEVLAIIAYRSPVTRSQIEAIRGVNCSVTLRNLLLRGLIERFENPDDSREYVYQPTFGLLEKLGLGSVKDLPQYEKLSQDQRLSFVVDEETSDPESNRLSSRE